MQCDMSYLTNSDLVRHMVMHNSMETYECDACDKAFLGNNELTAHMALHDDTNLSENRYETGETAHLCYVCENSFLTNRN